MSDNKCCNKNSGDKKCCNKGGEEKADPVVDNGALGNNLAEAMFTLRSPEQIAQQMQTAQEYYAAQEREEEKAKEEKNKGRPSTDKTLHDYANA